MGENEGGHISYMLDSHNLKVFIYLFIYLFILSLFLNNSKLNYQITQRKEITLLMTNLIYKMKIMNNKDLTY